MTDIPLPPEIPEDDDDLIAAELALGLLDGDEASAAAARMASDPVFAEKVRDWQERLARMAEDLTPVLAPARAKVMIDRALGHAVMPQVLPPARESGGFWRWLLGVGAVAAIAVLALIFVPPMLRGPGPDGAPEYAWSLADEAGAMRVNVAMNEADHMMEVEMAEGTAPTDHDLELWWIAGEGAQPVSLGLVPRDGNMARMAMPEGLVPAPDVVLAISAEPMGGSPTGAPTGEVVAQAGITTL